MPKMGLYASRSHVIISILMETSATSHASPGERYDAVLIDDDELVGATWRMAAQRAGQRLLVLASAEAFWSRAPHVSRTVPIYVDYNLSQERSGQQLVKELHAAGFAQLYIETGYDVAEITASVRRLLIDVQGKCPPWR